ncbi:MAG: hypothetical protein JNN13_12085 [Planctomycetes bacterium]|nr:hypothetical protein [Planctomycetota bacterium]MBZ0150084.1 hypothetical protein [Planctomycetota bacterium]MCC7395794.1 hypothetical protein [Planctomycetota bacterium]
MKNREAPPFSLLAEIAGWYGTFAIVGAYALNSFAVLATADRSYQLLNLTGALGVAWVCWRKRTWQAFWLESVWAAIACVALARSMFA